MKEETESELADKDLLVIIEGEANKKCNDCGRLNPRWCSINNAVLICSACARTHKKFNQNISRIKSLEVDQWTKEEVFFLKTGGNERFINEMQSYDIPLTKNNKEYKYYTIAAQYYRDILLEKSKNNDITHIIKPSLKEGKDLLYKDEYSRLFNQKINYNIINDNNNQLNPNIIKNNVEQLNNNNNQLNPNFNNNNVEQLNNNNIISNNHIKNINELSNQAETRINNYINESFNKLYADIGNLTLVKLKDLNNNIQSRTRTEIDKLIEYILQNLQNKEMEQKKENIIKKEIRVETKSVLNNFTSEDIQKENKEIIINFQNIAFNYMNEDNEKIENENIALFLKEVARISRLSYNEGKKLFKTMKERYNKVLKGSSNLINNEKSRKEFSLWIKLLEKEKGRKEYENIINQANLFQKYENNEQQQYLSKLFNDLTILYFHCDLSFPLVTISFKKEENFNSEKMIDFINKGKNRKVNFIILPSLFSNGVFLENGRSYAFTYIKDKTFKFSDLDIESLDKLIIASSKNVKTIKTQNIKKKGTDLANIKKKLNNY